MTRVSIVRRNLKEVGWQTSGLTDRNHIQGMVYRVRLPNKLKPNNYPKVYCVNVADRWRERTDAIYLILEDSSCSNEVAYLRVGWKPRVKDKNA